jgi:hypothetical protein
MQHINILWGQTAEFFSVKVGCANRPLFLNANFMRGAQYIEVKLVVRSRTVKNQLIILIN